MANKKKQHFVPKFLLRHFSNDENRKKIGVYNVNTRFYKEDCSLDGQAQESYFYDKDASVEDLLWVTENKAAPMIAQILNTSIVPKAKTLDYTWLLMLTVDQAFRTPVQADEFNETLDETVRMLMKFDKTMDHIDIDNLKARYEQPAAVAVGFAAKALFSTADLSLKLLINKTNTPFVLSDNPAIKYNQFLERLDHPGHHTVIHAKGLQIFLPISPTMILLYYDGWAYNVKDEHPVVNITNPYDVDKLNALQLIHCRNMIYFSRNIKEEYLEKNFNKYKHLRDVPAAVNEMKTLIHQGKCFASMQPIGGNKGFNLNLSFIKLTRKALTFDGFGRIIPIRKEDIREIHKLDTPSHVVQRMFDAHPPAFLD